MAKTLPPGTDIQVRKTGNKMSIYTIHLGWLRAETWLKRKISVSYQEGNNLRDDSKGDQDTRVGFSEGRIYMERWPVLDLKALCTMDRSLFFKGCCKAMKKLKRRDHYDLLWGFCKNHPCYHVEKNLTGREEPTEDKLWDRDALSSRWEKWRA